MSMNFRHCTIKYVCENVIYESELRRVVLPFSTVAYMRFSYVEVVHDDWLNICDSRETHTAATLISRKRIEI